MHPLDSIVSLNFLKAAICGTISFPCNHLGKQCKPRHQSPVLSDDLFLQIEKGQYTDWSIFPHLIPNELSLRQVAASSLTSVSQWGMKEIHSDVMIYGKMEARAILHLHTAVRHRLSLGTLLGII